MHILVMTRSTLHHGFGGFQRQCTDLCEGFVNRGHEVTVITTAHPEGEQMLESSGYTIHFVKPSKPRRLSRRWFKETRKLVDDIHQRKPIDVIHSNEFAGFGLCKWARKKGIPICLLCHGSLRSELLSFFASADRRPRYWHWLILTPFFLIKRYVLWEIPMRRTVSSIILVTPTIEGDFRAFCKGKVRVIENGITLPQRPEKKDSQGTLRLLCTGRADRQKGFQMAIMAISKLQDLDLHLDIVGTGDYLGELKKLAGRLELDDSVTFRGRVDDTELYRLYSESDMYLIPTLRYEGLPLALLEAMAHGIPTISSDIGGNSDVITHEKDGLFVRPGNLDELVEAIRVLASSADTRESLGNAARDTSERRFNKERMVSDTVEILRLIADPNSSNSSA
ncbi:MAG TPA: glycosyltransferase family 1 protein [Nitrospira sp.]|jgi:glycosyltransferase involved in cell wall biosynthesis|nr:glycosyltransferase family 1 protein [Candidatus Manganitrophaceae bacterium]